MSKVLSIASASFRQSALGSNPANVVTLATEFQKLMRGPHLATNDAARLMGSTRQLAKTIRQQGAGFSRLLNDMRDAAAKYPPLANIIVQEMQAAIAKDQPLGPVATGVVQLALRA